MNTAPDLDALRPWLDRQERVEETLSPVPMAALAATLSLTEAMRPRDTLPPLWHWLHFLDRTPSDRLADDGSPRSRALLPPIPLEQVMWAGSELEFVRPLAVSRPASRVSRILDMTGKTGSRGPMVFVTHEHRIEQDGETAVIERNRAVFLGPAAPGGGAPAAVAEPPHARRHAWAMNEAILFRYSALTFNSHRIHYDLAYATQVGGYPGLVVHGPLQATLLAETFRMWHPALRVRRIAFRARAPLYCGAPVTVCGAAPADGRHALWTLTPSGAPAMECEITADAG